MTKKKLLARIKILEARVLSLENQVTPPLCPPPLTPPFRITSSDRTNIRSKSTGGFA